MRFGKNLVLSLVVLVFALAGAMGDASAQNIVSNPGFETGDLTDWLVFGAGANASVTVVADNGPSEPGANAAFLENRIEANGLTLKFSAPAGSGGQGTVFYSFDLKLGEAANGGVFFVEIFAEQAGGGVIGGSGLLGNYTPANWTAISGSFVAPANTDFLTIQFTAPTGAVGGSVSSMYVDNVSLTGEGIVPTESNSWSGIKALYR